MRQHRKSVSKGIRVSLEAMLIRNYGGPEVLMLGEIETPRPGRGEVLVRVHASSVNPVDALIRSGALKNFVRLRMPAVLGVDVAGEVASVGQGVARFRPGERVFAFNGMWRAGGYGEFAVVPESCLSPLTAKLSWPEAGTVPGVGSTAYEALTEQAPLREGMRVLINGGAGGVGTFAVQIAKALGAHVTATCSASKTSLLVKLGADRVIDYAHEDPFALGAAPYDVIFNTVRGAPHAAMRRLLRPGGTLVTITGEHPGHVLAARLRSMFSSRRTVVFFVRSSGALLEGLNRLIEADKVRPVVEATYSWADLAEAHRRCETGRVAGKLAIVPRTS
jgi:NADPH:quinone reductase-like Zn-dependent oxidoreductase